MIAFCSVQDGCEDGVVGGGALEEAVPAWRLRGQHTEAQSSRLP